MIEVHIIRTPDPAYPHRYTHRLIVAPCPPLERSGFVDLRLNTVGQWHAETHRRTAAAVAASEVGDEATAHHHRAIAEWLATHTPRTGA